MPSVLQIFLLPLAGVHGRIGRGHLARQRQHQPDSQLGHGYGVCARRVHHHDAAPRGRIGVNVVHTNARPANHAQLGRVFHQCVVHLHSTAHHQRIGIGKGRR